MRRALPFNVFPRTRKTGMVYYYRLREEPGRPGDQRGRSPRPMYTTGPSTAQHAPPSRTRPSGSTPAYSINTTIEVANDIADHIKVNVQDIDAAAIGLRLRDVGCGRNLHKHGGRKLHTSLFQEVVGVRCESRRNRTSSVTLSPRDGGGDARKGEASCPHRAKCTRGSHRR